MVGYEYKIIPAPAKGLKAPGVKGPEARFANALEHRINELAAQGWEYQRSDILPSEERQGLTSSHTVYRSVLVFRRELAAETPDAVAVADAAADATEPEEIDPAVIEDEDLLESDDNDTGAEAEAETSDEDPKEEKT